MVVKHFQAMLSLGWPNQGSGRLRGGPAGETIPEDMGHMSLTAIIDFEVPVTAIGTSHGPGGGESILSES